MRFRPEQHVRRQGDFRRIREQGRRIHSGIFAAWWLPREDPADLTRRVGVVASIAAVGNAVQRNRAKRRLRAIFRENQDLVPAGGDLLLVARRAVNHQPFLVVQDRFLSTCRQLSPVSDA